MLSWCASRESRTCVFEVTQSTLGWPLVEFGVVAAGVAFLTSVPRLIHRDLPHPTAACVCSGSHTHSRPLSQRQLGITVDPALHSRIQNQS